MSHRFPTTVLALALASGCVHAQQPQSPPPPCQDAAYRQFDFWLGDWEVTGGRKLDTIVGRNTITRVSSGCALAEHWIDSSGHDGHSLNVYEPGVDRWSQFWIGSDGVVIRLVGGLQGKAMVMSGRLPAPKAAGGEQWQRITWTPGEDGSVNQHWQTSDDAGASWQTSFMGIYRKRPAAAP